VRQFLEADLVDHLHVAIVPIVLGRGERLWDGLEGMEERFEVETVASPSGAAHMTFERKS
jgi:dihydrofolate reductase